MKRLLILASLLSATSVMAESVYEYKIPCIEDLGGGVGGIDNTPAFNAAVAAYEAVRFCRPWSMGQYYFKTEPTIIAKQFAIYGALPSQQGNTWIYRDYQPSSSTRGLFHFTAGQPTVDGVMILAASGTGGAGLAWVPPVGGNSATGSWHNIRVTATGGTWDYSLYVNGSNLSSAPIGVRGLDIRNAMIFGATQAAVHLQSVVHFNWHGGSINQAGGANGNLVITGMPTVYSSENIISLDYVSGTVALVYVANTALTIGEVGGNVNNTSAASGIRGRGKVLGTVQNFWIDSSWN